MEGPFGTIESNGGLVEDLPVGVHQIIYIATNDCGMEGRDTLVLEIADDSTPTALCNANVSVPLNNSGMALVPAEGFDGGSLDNCNDVYFKARRMTPPIGYGCTPEGNPFYRFDDVVKFCCEDVDAGPIMVILRVYDTPPVPGPVNDDYLEGHFTDCMITVEVQDKIGPELEACPSDLTISCEFPFDPDNLSVFGDLVTDPDDREEICIDDPGNPWSDGLECIGLDGLVTDNCGVVVEEDRAMIMDSLCGTGQIIRTFTATDPGGRSVQCQQVITITNFTPFTEADITWPLDYYTSDVCDIDALNPENLPPGFSEPILDSDECDLVTFTYTDEVFDFSGSSEACFKILRHWVVLDWCQVDGSEPNAGRWEYLQVIKSNNSTPPVFTQSPADETTCGDIEDCGPGQVVLAATATDDCTEDETLLWRISLDYDNNGSMDEVLGPFVGASVVVPQEFPQGTHKAIYVVQDYCGNKAVEEQIIEIENCTPPSAKCQNITTTLMPVDLDDDGETDWGMITIWASDLDAGSDHPCSTAVTVAFSPDPLDIYRTFDCDDLGDNEVELWVIDEAGLTDFCIVTVTIQDNNLVCPDELGNSGIIAGAISTPSTVMMDDVMVMLDGSSATPVYTSGGQYVFPVMPLGGQYEVKPLLDVEPANGVSTIDLIQIQKHLLGIQTFDTPYKYVAADANNSGSVSAVDILELKKLILGKIDELPNNTSWRFIDEQYQWTDINNPLAEDFAESYLISPFAENMTDINFVGVKVGDLNESAQLFGGEEDILTGRSEMKLQIDRPDVSQSGLTTLVVSAEDLGNIDAVQFTLAWDQSAIEVLEVKPGARSNSDQWNDALLTEGMLPFSWSTLESGQAATDELFTLVVKLSPGADINNAVWLSSDVTREEGLTSRGKLVRPTLEVVGASTTVSDLVLGNNRPNPFSGQTIIPFEMAEAGSVLLTIVDPYGRMLYSETIDAKRGYNEFAVRAADIGARGVLLYSVETQNSKHTKRMIIAEE